MNTRSRVFLTRNAKTNSHFVFVIVSSESVGRKRGVLDIDTMNALVKWKNIDDLVDLLEKTGPLIPSDIYEGTGRIIPIDDAVEIAEANGRGDKSQGFVRCIDSSLRAQLYLDGRKELFPPKAAVKRGIAEHGLLESAAVDDLMAWAEEDPGTLVAIESISDLIFMRNLCSICLRVIANFQNPSVDDVLEASGFRHIIPNRDCPTLQGLGDSCYVIRLYNSPVNDTTLNFSWKWGDGVYAYMLADPINHLIGENEPEGVMLGFDYGDDYRLSYLAVRGDISLDDGARLIADGLYGAFSGLMTKKGEPLGWDFNLFPALASNDRPEPVFHSLASAMVGTLMFREGVLPVTCKNCGNGMLIRSKGKRREFCSDSCRSLYSAGKAHSDG